MTDYKKYINALRKCAKEHDNDRTFTGHIIVSDLCRDTANLLEALEQEPKWISVSERLPKWDIECLVVDDKGEFGVGFYRDDVGAWDSPSWGWLERKDEVDNHDAYYMPCGIGKVIAWMPLPKPYEPQKSEKINCKSTKCENCINHNYCDYEPQESGNKE